jgi:hypothetical protein
VLSPQVDELASAEPLKTILAARCVEDIKPKGPVHISHNRSSLTVSAAWLGSVIASTVS